MSKIEEIRSKNFGFIYAGDLPAIIAENRFQQCLVRCGGGRFICPAQNVEHFTRIIGNEESDYVRDVSLVSF